MSVRRTIGLIVLTNVAFVAVVVGLFYFSGLAAASPGAQGTKPQLPPITSAFPLTHLPGDQDPEANPNAPAAPIAMGTFYYSLAAPVFQPKSSDGVKTSDAGFGCTYGSSTTGNPIGEPVVAPLTLPQGAVLTELRAYWYKSTTPTEQLNMDIKRSNMLGTVDNILSVNSVNVAVTGYYSSTAAFTQTVQIDNTRYAYYVQAKFNRAGSGIRLCGARVGYSSTLGNNWAAEPLINKNSPYP